MTRQRGVALVTVLLVVALAATVCAALVVRQQLSIRGSANQLQARQAWQYARGGEQLALGVLRADLHMGGSVDHGGEPWAQRLPAYPVDGGEVRVDIDDLAGRFNLNSVVHQGQLDADALARLQRLLRLLQLDPQLAWQLVDWVSPGLAPDSVHRQAERDYQARTPAYRPAARGLRDTSELRLLAGVDDRVYQRLLPHVSALPATAALNLNTADAWVLASLADGLGMQDGQRLVAARGASGFASVDAFLAQPLLQQRWVARNGLAVRSNWFVASSEAAIGARRLRLLSVLQREGGDIRVVSRQLAPPLVPENVR
ncbi:type II secretion system minor pseudopilin GspK [Stenotrophomonas sp.]|uniref:type II secretion system minor pseudopilin GspK n=1 Tax=Stenotrophomonas sp. TaxID=69392 RepID=UPI00289E10B9|nr:type II secretion system minor pseudopilin GspK [Stenotrophomonas sp.]